LRWLELTLLDGAGGASKSRIPQSAASTLSSVAANSGYFAVRGLLAKPIAELRASLSFARRWQKVAQFWCVYWHRSHPISVSSSLRRWRPKLCPLSARSAAQQ
jgi:hypothetical protein